MARAAFDSVEELQALLVGLDGVAGHDQVPVLAHLLQTAELLDSTTRSRSDPELVAAGLLHDIAGALGSPGDEHGAEGARLVRPLLGGRVADLVEGHVDAKRYLVTVEPGYGSTLSADSSRTLALEGGAMTPAEVGAFRACPEYEALVSLRRADDGAKVAGRPVRPVAHWWPLIDEVAALAGSQRA